jgi:hypothetical protein
MKSCLFSCLCIASVVLSGVPAIASSQDHPNLAGDWVPVSGGPRLTITQDPTELTVVQHGLKTLVFLLDGPDGYQSAASNQGEPMIYEAQTRWAGSTIVVALETTLFREGRLHNWTDTYVYALTSDDKLSVTCFCATTTGGEHHRSVRTTDYDRSRNDSG